MLELLPENYPPLLHEIPTRDIPDKLWALGTLPWLSTGEGAAANRELKYLCVIGSRKYTPYGREACERLIAGLAGFPILIVSGLAYGIDSIAHKAALKASLRTIAIPGSGLDPSVLYPKHHARLADKILTTGGALLSELPPTQAAAPWDFPRRNRIMAGMSHATLVIEAAEKSGTHTTAKLALEYNREVLAVPGSIFSIKSVGVNKLLWHGATPILSSEDIIHALGLEPKTTPELPLKHDKNFPKKFPSAQHQSLQNNANAVIIEKQ